MKEELEFFDLGEYCEVIAGQSPEGKYYNSDGNGLPFYQGKKEFDEKFIGSPTKWTTKTTKEAIEGDVLMSVRAPVGPINFATQRICIGRRLAAIRASNQINRDFLFYHLLAKQDEISGTEGAVFNSINKGQIGKLQIIVPPLPEQERIVAKLDAAFTAIDQAKANVEQNLNSVEELFLSAKDEILRVNCDEWPQTTLGKSCKFYNGKAHEKDIVEDGDFIVVNSKFISRNGTVLKFTAQQMFPLFTGDIVMVMSDVPNGKALAKCYVIEEDDKYSLNQRICAIRTTEFDKVFLFHQLNRHPYLLEFNNGENQTNLRKGDILDTPLFLPPIEKQQEIAEKMNDLVDMTNELATTYTQKLTELEDLKKSLLERAFKGEI